MRPPSPSGRRRRPWRSSSSVPRSWSRSSKRTCGLGLGLAAVVSALALVAVFGFASVLVVFFSASAPTASFAASSASLAACAAAASSSAGPLGLGLVVGLLGRLGRALAAERDVGDAQDGQLLAMALLDAAARLGPVLERDQLGAAGLGDDLGADRRVGDQRPADRGLVAVGDQQDAIDGDRLARFDVEKLDLELRADFDAVLLTAGLDDCVHGSSGLRVWRPRAAIATSDCRKGARRRRAQNEDCTAPSTIRSIEAWSAASIQLISQDHALANQRGDHERTADRIAERCDDLLRPPGPQDGVEAGPGSKHHRRPDAHDADVGQQGAQVVADGRATLQRARAGAPWRRAGPPRRPRAPSRPRRPPRSCSRPRRPARRGPGCRARHRGRSTRRQPAGRCSARPSRTRHVGTNSVRTMSASSRSSSSLAGIGAPKAIRGRARPGARKSGNPEASRAVSQASTASRLPSSGASAERARTQPPALARRWQVLVGRRLGRRPWSCL